VSCRPACSLVLPLQHRACLIASQPKRVSALQHAGRGGLYSGLVVTTGVMLERAAPGGRGARVAASTVRTDPADNAGMKWARALSASLCMPAEAQGIFCNKAAPRLPSWGLIGHQARAARGGWRCCLMRGQRAGAMCLPWLGGRRCGRGPVPPCWGRRACLCLLARVGHMRTCGMHMIHAFAARAVMQLAHASTAVQRQCAGGL
jgi:hypothetical protein